MTESKDASFNSRDYAFILFNVFFYVISFVFLQASFGVSPYLHVMLFGTLFAFKSWDFKWHIRFNKLKLYSSFMGICLVGRCIAEILMSYA
ncbi:hypothetical protein VCHA53O466_50397 [Vibrio chagasii]|nr:hypothetical protein VCHA53O466_50397 [Vibrio chagasii]